MEGILVWTVASLSNRAFRVCRLQAKTKVEITTKARKRTSKKNKQKKTWAKKAKVGVKETVEIAIKLLSSLYGRVCQRIFVSNHSTFDQYCGDSLVYLWYSSQISIKKPLSAQNVDFFLRNQKNWTIFKQPIQWWIDTARFKKYDV